EPCQPVEPIRPKSWMPKPKAKPKGPSPAYLAAKARMAAFHASAEPARKAKPDLPKSKPKELSEEERRLARHVQAFRKSKLKLSEFCQREGLDPASMRQALASHHKRAKERIAEQGR
ncbi:MAG: hypothetical protein ACR2RF_23090, partial [Geminicoccaceae bacterium]